MTNINSSDLASPSPMQRLLPRTTNTFFSKDLYENIVYASEAAVLIGHLVENNYLEKIWFNYVLGSR